MTYAYTTTRSIEGERIQATATISDYGAYFFCNGLIKKIPATEPLGDSVHWRQYIIFDIERSTSKLIYNTENGAVSDALSAGERTSSTRLGFFPLKTDGTDILLYLDGIAYELDPVTLRTINRYLWEKTEDVRVEYGYLRNQNDIIVPWKEKEWKRTLRDGSPRDPHDMRFMISYPQKYFMITLLPDMLSQSNYYAYNGVNDQFVFIINNTPPIKFDEFSIDYTFTIQRNGLYTIDGNYNLITLHLNDDDNPRSNAFLRNADQFENILFIQDTMVDDRHLLFDTITGMTKIIDIWRVNYIEFINENKLVVYGEIGDWDSKKRETVRTDTAIEINFDNRNTLSENIGRHIFMDYDSNYSFQHWIDRKSSNPVYRNKRLFELYNKNIVIEYEMTDEEISYMDEFIKEYPNGYSQKYNIYMKYNEKSNMYLIWADNLGRWLD